MKKLLMLFLICSGLTVTAQTTEDLCNLTLVLTNESGKAIGDQKFRIKDTVGQVVVESVTNAEGKATMKLKKNTNFQFEAEIGGRMVMTKIPIESDNRFVLELQLAVVTEAPKDVRVLLHVTDDKGIPETQTVLAVADGADTVYNCITDLDGICRTELKRGKTYSLIAQKFDKKFNVPLNIPNDPDLVEYKFDLKIRVVEKIMRSFVLKNVYFDYNKWNIKPESVAALTELYDAMKANSRMTIEVGGHTDSDGDDPSNLRLSQRRADAVKQYIVSKGIDASRMITKGYGETTPIATNDTDEGRAKNRRTEIKVINE